MNESNASPFLREITEDFTAQTGISLADLENEDYAVSLFKRIQQVFPDDIQELIDEDVLAIGEIADPTPNAHCKDFGDGRFAVVFNSGLRDFIYRVARVLGTRFEQHGSKPTVGPNDFDELVQIVTDIFFWFNETNRSYGPSYEIRRDQALIASMLATAAETFFLAHELGHVLLRVRTRVGSQFAQSPLSEAEEEFEADRIALIIVMMVAAKSDSDLARAISYAGTELALNIFAGLTALGVQFSGPHPPAHERLEAIRKNARTLCADEDTYNSLTVLSKGLDTIFQSIIKRISEPDHKAFLDRASQSVVRDLDILLERCTGGMVPDYATFYSEASHLFNRGYSHRLHASIAEAACDFFTKAQRLSGCPTDKGEALAARIAFQKFKLFMGFVMNMPEPARSIFEGALSKAAQS